ncbi:MAG: GPW/gp25 family protein [Roseiflexaceae bacterium]|nr:GPW/gp25 family protein [Roseiflexaceae bacterium]
MRTSTKLDVGTIFGRGVSFPPRIGPDGRISWSVGEDNVRECMRIILQTEPGERIERPDFGGGLTTFLFEPNNSSTHERLRMRIVQALVRWEPRISVEQVRVSADPDDLQAAIATVEYRLVATQVREQISMTVVLAG